uniref:hypothetical protein n=1 Tax=Cellvibrio fontiphilus TaxID=1815559 RepID=UPI002B4BAE32|nr:hypothetical protein [Cellvibrio fontiphilus]
MKSFTSAYRKKCTDLKKAFLPCGGRWLLLSKQPENSLQKLVAQCADGSLRDIG